jgi:hypothetical protein
MLVRGFVRTDTVGAVDFPKQVGFGSPPLLTDLLLQSQGLALLLRPSGRREIVLFLGIAKQALKWMFVCH